MCRAFETTALFPGISFDDVAAPSSGVFCQHWSWWVMSRDNSSTLALGNGGWHLDDVTANGLLVAGVRVPSQAVWLAHADRPDASYLLWRLNKQCILHMDAC